jgi:perosamine synthetase
MQEKPRMKIRLFKPCVGEEELANIRSVFDRAWLGLGPLVGQFEREWSEYIGAASSMGVNSATAALHLALTTYGFREGAKVLVPAITFVSTATAALYNRLEPVFVDVEPATLSISFEDLERKVSEDCVAVIPVHLGGHPVAMERLLDFSKAHHLAVIEDCAHCAGGVYRGRRLGTWGDIGCFSFEEKKCMTTGDGGMLTSDDADLIEPLRAYRWVGIDKDTWKRAAGYTSAEDVGARHWYYEVDVLGYKYNMNDLMAAIGLAQLKKLDWMNERRRRAIGRYLEGIRGCEQIQPLLPYQLDGSAYWLFGVRCERRDELIMHMKQRGIATGVHFLPLPMHPLFSEHAEPVPNARRVWETVVTLPLFPELSDDEIDYVVEALCEFDRA